MTQPIRLLADGHPDTGFVPSNLVAESDFTTQDTSETISSFFESQDRKISVGVWECAPSREEIMAYPVDEMMTVISGALTLTGSDGTEQEFVAGDTFFIPKGTACVWEITRTLRKFYMIAE